MECVLVYITAENKQRGVALARALLEERLIACANVLEGAISVYRWEGEVREASECVIVAKSTAGRAEALTERVKALHGYDCPCVAVVPISGGNGEFLKWVEEETA